MQFYTNFIFFPTMSPINVRPNPCVTHRWHARLHAKFRRHTSHHFRGDSKRTLEATLRQLYVYVALPATGGNAFHFGAWMTFPKI